MAASTAPNSNTNRNDPFSFTEILAPRDDDQVKQDPVKVLASDGVDLAIFIYEPPTVTKSEGHKHKHNANTALVFYHGGGAHAGAGYPIMARGLAENFGITVYLPDLRGHGASAGARGDAPSKEQVWRDVDTVLEFVADRHHGKQQQQASSSSRIFLGGHSSGGGLVVNYATAAQEGITTTTTTAPSTASISSIDGYVLVSPELGYKSGTARPNRTEFAAVNLLAFIANGIFGILGHSKAVRFNYPPELLEADNGMIGFNTVNMANAITLESPVEQMQAIGKNNDVDVRKPIGLWVGSDDELFVAEKVVGLVPKNNHDNDNIIGEILPGKNHLGILVDVHDHIGSWITKSI